MSNHSGDGLDNVKNSKNENSDGPALAWHVREDAQGLETTTPAELKTTLTLGTKVEINELTGNKKYGVVRWIGLYWKKPIVGLELETGCQSNNYSPQSWYLISKFITHLPSTKVYFANLLDVQPDQRIAEPRIDESTWRVHAGAQVIVSMSPAELNTTLTIGARVEVKELSENPKYGVVRWLGRYGKDPIVGLEMEMGRQSVSYNSPLWKLDSYFTTGIHSTKVYFAHLDDVWEDQHIAQSGIQDPTHQHLKSSSLSPSRLERNGPNSGDTTQGSQERPSDSEIQHPERREGAQSQSETIYSVYIKTTEGRHETISEPERLAKLSLDTISPPHDFTIGSTVEVIGMPKTTTYGIVRWFGVYNKEEFVGLEMDNESSCYQSEMSRMFPSPCLLRLTYCSPERTYFVKPNQVNKVQRPATQTGDQA